MTCRFPFAIMLYPFCKHRKKFRLYRNISTTPRSRWSNGSRKGYTLKGVAEERGMAGIPQERKSPTPNIPGEGPVPRRRLHGALNTDAYEPPIHGVRGDEAANHADLHHEPKNRLIGRHGAYQKEHSYGHPAVHPTCQAVSDKKSTLKALNQRERPRSWLIEANPAYWKKTPMIRANT